MTDRKSYHHGNLRQALVDAALRLINEKGPAGFSFAEAARIAGVSPAAPYRHFKDRDALLAETARVGFERFADRLEAAWDGGKPSPLSALEALGRAYLAFARDEPALYAAMFEAGVKPSSDPALKGQADRAFGVLHAACARLADTAPEGTRPPAHMMAYHIWSLSHGVAALFGGPGETARRAPISAEDLLESAIAVYLRGLGLIPS